MVKKATYIGNMYKEQGGSLKRVPIDPVIFKPFYQNPYINSIVINYDFGHSDFSPDFSP